MPRQALADAWGVKTSNNRSRDDPCGRPCLQVRLCLLMQ